MAEDIDGHDTQVAGTLDIAGVQCWIGCYVLIHHMAGRRLPFWPHYDFADPEDGHQLLDLCPLPLSAKSAQTPYGSSWSAAVLATKPAMTACFPPLTSRPLGGRQSPTFLRFGVCCKAVQLEDAECLACLQQRHNYQFGCMRRVVVRLAVIC